MAPPQLATSVNLGTFDRFSEGWLTCLRKVLDAGHLTHDGQIRLKEVVNVSLSAWACDSQDLVNAGASPDRLRLMVEKYETLAVLPAYRISYGKLFREHAGVDQIEWLVERLRLRPETKSATIGFHIPGDDVLSCISLVDCKLRAGLLHLTAVFRSQNVFASQPGNACALRRVQTRIAEGVGVPPGALTLHVMSAHIYEGDWDAAHRVVSAITNGDRPYPEQFSALDASN
jgi:thymidylate synthase